MNCLNSLGDSFLLVGVIIEYSFCVKFSKQVFLMHSMFYSDYRTIAETVGSRVPDQRYRVRN